jgi:hypothetical protein
LTNALTRRGRRNQVAARPFASDQACRLTGVETGLKAPGGRPKLFSRQNAISAQPITVRTSFQTAKQDLVMARQDGPHDLAMRLP